MDNAQLIRKTLEGPEFLQKLASLLPDAISPRKFAQIVWMAATKNPKLQQCSLPSFLRCVGELAAMGLYPDGRRAHLIPRGNTATYVVDFKGMKEILLRNGDVLTEHSDIVCSGDQFSFSFGSNQHLTHSYDPKLRRGEMYCAYSYVRLPGGAEKFEIMSKEEIEAIRKRSAAGNDGPWVTDWNQMAIKTVFRRLSKGLPLSDKSRDAVESGDDNLDATHVSPLGEVFEEVQPAPSAKEFEQNLEKSLAKSVEIVEAQQKQPEIGQAGPKKRGRPRREQHEQSPRELQAFDFEQTGSESSRETVPASQEGSSEAGDLLGGTPDADQQSSDPKSLLIAEIRSNLLRDHKTEGRLLAKLAEWQYPGDPSQGLEGYDLTTITNIAKRWNEALKHL